MARTLFFCNFANNISRSRVTMTPLRKIIIAAILSVTVLAGKAANRAQTIFIYGFAASFNDSTVYFTDLQTLDSAYIDSRSKFLYSRENYSYQLQDYLANRGFEHAVCICSFALKRKDAEKKYLKLRKKYIEGGRFNIKYLKPSEFTFHAIKPE